MSRERRHHERAGGVEDWEDVEGGDVDRYGFISQVRPASSSGTPEADEVVAVHVRGEETYHS